MKHHKVRTESSCFTFLCHVLCQLLRLQVPFIFLVQDLETQVPVTGTTTLGYGRVEYEETVYLTSKA